MKTKRNRNRNNKKHTRKNFKGGSINPSRLPELLYERIYPTKSKDKRGDVLKCTTNWLTTCSKLDNQLSNIFLQIILKTINESYAHIPTYRETINKLCDNKNRDTHSILDKIHSYRKFANKYLTYNTNVDKFNQLDMETKYIIFDLVATLDSNVSFLFCIQNAGNNINNHSNLNDHIKSTFKPSQIPLWYIMTKYLFSPVDKNKFTCACDAIYFLIHDTKTPKTKSYYCNINWKLASPKDIEKSTEDTVYICENYIFDTPKEVFEIYKNKYLETAAEYNTELTEDDEDEENGHSITNSEIP